MARKAHFVTFYVVVLHSAKKANSCNKYAVCRACISVEEAYKINLPTQKENVHVIFEIVQILLGNIQLKKLKICLLKPKWMEQNLNQKKKILRIQKKTTCCYR